MITLRINEINTKGKRDHVIENLNKRISFLINFCNDNSKTDAKRRKAHGLVEATYMRKFFMHQHVLTSDYYMPAGTKIQYTMDENRKITYTKAPYFYPEMMEAKRNGTF